MQRLKELKEKIGPERAKHVDSLCRKGTSAWLTSLPLLHCGFTLNKQEFCDALHLRYNFRLRGTLTFCSSKLLIQEGCVFVRPSVRVSRKLWSGNLFILGGNRPYMYNGSSRIVTP